MNLIRFFNQIARFMDRLCFRNPVVLTYHSVSDGSTPISVRIDNFKKQMAFLKESGIDVLNLEEYLQNKKRGVLITFDDAFKDVYLNALPVLREYNLPAVIFINPSLLGKRAEFATLEQDRARDICALSDLLELEKGGVTIANHGYNHRQLSGLSEEELFYEFENARIFINDNFINNSHPNAFVFPKGAKNEQVKNFLNNKGAKILDERIDIYSDTSLLGFALKLSPFYLWLRKKLIITKKHWLALALATLVGLLMVAPTISAIWSISSDFNGIYPMLSNDEDQYLGMTREAYDGHYNFGSVYLKEHKDVPYLQQPLAEIIFAAMAKALDMSVPELFVINDFILPFIGVLILYFLILALTQNRNLSALFSFLYYFLLISQFNRPINPQFSFLFLFLGLLLIWKIVKNEDGSFKKIFILNGLFALDFAIAFYIYPFVWSAILVVYLLSLLAMAMTNRRFAYYFKNFLVFATTSFVFTVPFILNLKQAVLNPNYIDQNLRFGFLTTHFPHAYFNVGLMVIGLVALFLVGRRLGHTLTVFVYCLAIGGIILNWQNVITGKAFSFSMHYFWVVVLFLLTIFSVCFSVVIDNYRKSNLDKKGFLVVVLIFMSIGGLFYRGWGRNLFNLSGLVNSVDLVKFREYQKLASVAEWFEQNSPRDSSVMSLGGNHHWFVTSYTYNNDFQNANAGLFLVSDDELEDRWVTQNYFTKGIDSKYIERHSVEIWANKFIERYQNIKIKNKILSFVGMRETDESLILVPQEYIDRVLDKVKMHQKLGFRESIKRYSVDYILLDTNDQEYKYLVEEFKKMEYLSLEATLDNNLIFKVANQ